MLSRTVQKWLFRNLGGDFHASGLSALAEQLSLLFRQYPQPGIRESLMLLCWCELAKGIEPEAWYTLHLLLPATLKKWINTRQKELNGLSALTEDYIRATRPL
ncbi:hypothetical protein AB01_5163 [Escherichia coli 2-177-06_S1_C1]|nr:hypothetical protein AD10_5157 [Escherichia coli 1-182-04_S4_C2]EZJ60435.1 hypothetical protein AC82_2750 [Escherichia coli 1-182-04_S4_C1]KDW11909.1 hypothetical protein AB01_5163 [Escherichia coli 2-177-06_S1_C1]KDW38190.1 hypothetical protein AB29_5434 [Escherichia coli 2-177-06_S1_C2]